MSKRKKGGGERERNMFKWKRERTKYKNKYVVKRKSVYVCR